METRGARARRAAAEAAVRTLGLALMPTFAALPPAVTLRISLAVPVDTRLRCREVSRAWRDALSAERALWTHLDLWETSGARVLRPLLEAAAARANGGLVSLNVPYVYTLHDALVAVCAANARTLRELRMRGSLSCADFGTLLRAAPSLQLLEADGWFNNAPEARQVLRREGHFAPVRLGEVSLRGALDDEQLFDFTAACGAHASLQRIALRGVLSGSRAALEAVVDAALTAQVEELSLGGGGWGDSGVNAASAPALARLLSSSTWLTSLAVDNQNVPLADAPSAQALGAALRANRTPRRLDLNHVDLFRDMAVADALLSALVGHPSLATVILEDRLNEVTDAAAAGAMLAALVAANAPALRILSIRHIRLRDAGVRPLVDALPHNTHLTTLTLNYCGMSDGFAHGPLLDAVRANESLRKLGTGHLVPAAAATLQVYAARRAAAPW